MRRKLLAIVLVVMALTLLPIVVAGAEPTTMADPSIGSSFYAQNQTKWCTWYALGRYKQFGGDQNLSGLGDAKDWYANATARGLRVGSTPEVGAVACWNAASTNGFSDGHVAVVEWVSADLSTIRVSQYNRGYSAGYKFMFGGYNDSYKWTANYLEKVPGKSFPPKPSGYIYLHKSSTPVKTTITFSSLTVPGTLTEGTDAMLDGSFTSTNSKICNVKAEVCDAPSGAVKLSAASGGNFSVWTYGPLTNSKLNTDLDLGKLTAGTYYVRYTVTTQDGTTASKSTANFTVTHAWGGWATVKAASCGVAGSRKRTCSRCGQTETETIAALSHNYQKISSTAAYDVYACANCKDGYRVDKVKWLQRPSSESGTRSVYVGNRGDTELSCRCLVARYQDGRLVSLTQEVLNIPTGTSKSISTSIPLDTGDETWKVFVLDDQSCVPLLPSLEY